jgi:2-methylcitrate dehydratase PrpD
MILLRRIFAARMSRKASRFPGRPKAINAKDARPRSGTGGLMAMPNETAGAGLTATLAGYIASALGKGPPAEIIEKTKLHVLDTVAAMVSGSRLAPGRAVLKFIANQGGIAEATIAGSRITTTAINAAWANGMLAHADETDDSHAPSLSHPGCGVVPAALAVAERHGRSGIDFLKAVTLGYDVGTRITQALTIRSFYIEGHKATHAVAALFGAAAAAGALCRIDARQARHLLSYTAQQSSGIASWQRDPDHIEKAFVFGGMPARNGVTSALMVESGFTGVDDVFHGPDNYFDAYSPSGDRQRVVDRFGELYEVTRANIKKWTVGSPVQAPLDAIVELCASGVRREDIRAIEVRVGTREAKVVDNRASPEICLQHLLAVLLVDGELGFAATHNAERMQDPKVLKERAKISLVYDDELEKDLPRRRAIVNIELNSGGKRQIRVDAVRGTAENPMTEAEVRGKAYDLMAPILGAAGADRVCDGILDMGALPDLKTFTRLLEAD